MISIFVKAVAFVFLALALCSIALGTSSSDVNAFYTNLAIAFVVYAIGAALGHKRRSMQRSVEQSIASPEGAFDDLTLELNDDANSMKAQSKPPSTVFEELSWNYRRFQR